MLPGAIVFVHVFHQQPVSSVRNRQQDPQEYCEYRDQSPSLADHEVAQQRQRSQGLSLKKYAGKEIHIYTCPLVEDGQEGVYSALYVYRGKVIGGDVHSVDFEGYMRPLFPASENG